MKRFSARHKPGKDPLLTENQQILRPRRTGDFMTSLFDPLPSSLRLLDAGAGEGALAAAVVRRACEGTDGVRTIDVTAYEIDAAILPELERTMDECRSLCLVKGIEFSASIHHADFIQEMARQLFVLMRFCRRTSSSKR